MKQIRHYQILLVDDEMLLTQSLKRMIEETDEDFQICATASNGEEALGILSQTDVQAVITDIRMPIMDGLELTEKIRLRYPDMPIILLTGYADFQYARSALRNGALDYLLKPVSTEDVSAMLSKMRSELSKTYQLAEQDIAGFGGSGGEESVRAALDILHTRYMEELDFGCIASDLGFSSAYLTKLFNKYVGETPLKYLTGIRIAQAKRLLSDTTLSIGEVGEHVGYPDQFHFSKTFRKLTGVTPSAYRKGGSDIQ